VASDRNLQMLDSLINEGRTSFTAADAREALSLSPQATSNVLRRLTDSGLLEQLAPGRYAARQIGALGTAAVWDDLGSAVAVVFSPHPHRIGFLTALDHHGLLIRPVRPVQVASPFRSRLRALSARPLRVFHENADTVRIGTEPLGPSRISTAERALLDVGSNPRLGIDRLAEALASAALSAEIGGLAADVGALAGYRRVGSIASTLALPAAANLEPPHWRSLIELDRRAREDGGWVDTNWGVAWPYAPSRLQEVVAR
jgi:predicted transcriptional regulator of viral defense system